jgi:hypothetical protein
MLKKIILPSITASVILIFIIYLNTYSICLWKYGFSEKDIYEQVAITNYSSSSYFLLLANDNRFGILYMKHDVFGIWHAETMSSIVDKKSTIRTVAASTSRFNIPLSSANTFTDSFYAGVVNKQESEKLFSLPQQTGSSFSTDIYQLSQNRYLVLFHITSNNDKILKLTYKTIETNIEFEKF